jgi:hypothetical protein
MDDIFNSREFQLFDYSPTFNRVLIRSVKNDKFESNLDLIFTGVKFVNIPVGFNGDIRIKLIENRSDINLHVENIKENDKIYEISYKGYVYHLAAFNVLLIENKLDALQSSIEQIDYDWFEYKKLDLSL